MLWGANRTSSRSLEKVRREKKGWNFFCNVFWTGKNLGGRKKKWGEILI
jgi:hypothetical protein